MLVNGAKKYNAVLEGTSNGSLKSTRSDQPCTTHHNQIPRTHGIVNKSYTELLMKETNRDTVKHVWQ